MNAVGTMVSVPLSGLASVNAKGLMSQGKGQTSFRPLIGVSSCKHNKNLLTVLDHIVSVPLSGLASVNIVYMPESLPYTVFVPLSGLASVNESGYTEWETRPVFVPLSGLASVNISRSLFCMWTASSVFVPLSGLAPVNTLSSPSPYKSRPPRVFSVPKI